MSNSKEKLSAYLDDDLSPDELESLLRHDSSLDDEQFDTATRYHMMGDAMRGELGEASLVDISAQVRDALRDETLQATASDARPVTSSLFDFNAWFAPFIRPLGGVAVAASVALVTVIAVTRVDTTESPSAQLAEAEHQKVNIPVTAVVARQVKQPTVSSVAVNNKAANGASSSRKAAVLDAYLTEHAEFAAQDTMQGRMPYARAVSYESR